MKIYTKYDGIPFAKMRFDTRIPKKDIDKIIEDFKWVYEQEIKGTKKDLRNILEHNVIGGSDSLPPDPLMPYVIMSGLMNVREALEARASTNMKTADGIRGVYRPNKIGIESGYYGRNLDLEIPESLVEELKKLIEQELKHKNYKYHIYKGSIKCKFDKAEFDQITGRMIMPFLSVLGENELPEGMKKQIKLKEYECWGSRGVAEQDGWRFDFVD